MYRLSLHTSPSLFYVLVSLLLLYTWESIFLPPPPTPPPPTHTHTHKNNNNNNRLEQMQGKTKDNKFVCLFTLSLCDEFIFQRKILISRKKKVLVNSLVSFRIDKHLE